MSYKYIELFVFYDIFRNIYLSLVTKVDITMIFYFNCKLVVKNAVS